MGRSHSPDLEEEAEVRTEEGKDIISVLFTEISRLKSFYFILNIKLIRININ